MSIRYEHEEPVKTTPERAFALVDDLPRTREWLPPCVSLEKVGAGPNAVGDTLKYVYQQGGNQGEMSGKIVARKPGEQLHCLYQDKMFDVVVDLRMKPSADGVIMTHIIEITPKSLMAKLMSPLIKSGLAKQTRDAAANLKKLLESKG